MVDFMKLFGLKADIDETKIPRHIAVTISGCKAKIEKNPDKKDEIIKKEVETIKKVIKTCIKLKVPMFSFQFAETETDDLIKLFNDLLTWDLIKDNQIKVSVLGKWYDISGRLVEPVKKLISETKDYDKHFLNLCVNYDGQQEILDAVRVIARQIKDDKVDPDRIDKSIIKENMYTSYLLPPGLIIVTGKCKKLGGFLLWDSVNSKIFFSEKSWPDFDKSEFFKAVEWSQK